MSESLSPWAALPVLLASLLAAAFATPSFAALAPYWERVSEMQAILASKDVETQLKSIPIDAIAFLAADQYDVLAGPCTLPVKIVDVPPKPGDNPILGPRQFTLEIGAIDCLPEDASDDQ